MCLLLLLALLCLLPGLLPLLLPTAAPFGHTVPALPRAPLGASSSFCKRSYERESSHLLRLLIGRLSEKLVVKVGGGGEEKLYCKHY